MVGPGATIGRSSGSGPLLEPAVISYGIYPPDDAAPSQGFFFSILIVASDSISIYSFNYFVQSTRLGITIDFSNIKKKGRNTLERLEEHEESG